MVIVYDSLTGQSKKFAERLGYQVADIKKFEGHQELIFLVTRSFNFGEIPKETQHFLEQHQKNVVGVAVSGNRNWGKNYGAAGDKIMRIYGLPLVLKFEASGMPHEVEIVKKWIDTYLENKNKEHKTYGNVQDN